MSRWKKTLIAAGVVVVVLFAALYAFFALYDFNNLKPLIAKRVKNATGRELTVAGNIKFEIGFRPILVAEDVSLANAAWGSVPQMIRVKRLEAQIAVLPLILGNFDFTRAVFVEPDVIVELNQEGISNFSFKAPGTQQRESAPSPPPLIFNNVLFEKGRFNYRDAQTDLKFSIRIDRLRADIPGFDKSLRILDFKGAFDDRPFTFKGTAGPIWAWAEPGYVYPANLTFAAGGATAHIKGEIHDPTHFRDLAFSITAGGPSAAAVAKLAGVKDMPQLGAFELAAEVADPQGILAVEKLNMQIGSKALVAVSVSGGIKNLPALQDIQLKFTAQGRNSANLTQLGVPPLPRNGPFKVTAEISEPQPKVFKTADLSIALGSNEVNGPVTLDLAEKVPYLTARLSSQKFELSPASLDLELSDPFEKPAIKKLDLKLGTPQLVEIQLKGTVENLIEVEGVDINFEARGRDLANLKQLTGKPLPVRGAFSAAGDIQTPAAKHLKIPNLEITAGQNTITGSLDLDWAQVKPALAAVLSTPQLNLPSVLQPDLAGQGWAKGVGLVRPVQLSVQLAGLDQKIAVKQVDLQAGTLDSAKVRLNGSVESLAPLRGVDLTFSAQGKELAQLKEILAQPYLFAPMPGQGAYAVSGHVGEQADDVLTVKDFKFVLAENQLTGRLVLNLAAQPPQYEVDLSAPKFNLKPFPIPKEAAYANLNRINDLGPLKIRSQVIVKSGQLSLSQFQLQAGSEQLARLQVGGSIQDLTTQSGIDLRFDIQGKDVAHLEKITGRSLPLQGVYAISGRLRDAARKNFNISDLTLKLGPDDITGRLDLNLSSQQLQLSTELASPKFSLQPVTLPAFEKISRYEDLGPFKLTLKLAGPGDQLALKNLDLRAGSEKIIALSIEGTIRNLSGMEGVNLKFSVSGDDISKLTAVGGPKINSSKAFRVAGRFENLRPKVYKLSGFDAAWGDSRSSGWLELDTAGQRPPRLAAELASEKLDLRPFLGYPQSVGDETEKTGFNIQNSK
ncbi:MAG: AsmA family protein [Desulfobacterales bacterium]